MNSKKSTEDIKRLGEELKEECIRKNVAGIGGFLVMFDEESGHTIQYRKDMPIEETDRSENQHIKHLYTGFVQGNILFWNPISEERIAEWLDKYHYKIDDFIKSFRG